MDDRTSGDRSDKADTTLDGRRSAESRMRLAGLSERLKSQFDVEVNDAGLIVRDQTGSGVVTVTCRRRSDDGDRLWFFASCEEPVAEADQIPDTVVAINGYLAGRRS